MKTKITIDIDATFGSEFQEENALKAISLMLKGWKGFYTGTHKKNKIEYEVTVVDSI